MSEITKTHQHGRPGCTVCNGRGAAYIDRFGVALPDAPNVVETHLLLACPACTRSAVHAFQAEMTHGVVEWLLGPFGHEDRFNAAWDGDGDGSGSFECLLCVSSSSGNAA